MQIADKSESDIQMSTIQMVCHFNRWPFQDWTNVQDLNTGLVHFSGPHYTFFFTKHTIKIVTAF